MTNIYTVAPYIYILYVCQVRTENARVVVEKPPGNPVGVGNNRHDNMIDPSFYCYDCAYTTT